MLASSLRHESAGSMELWTAFLLGLTGSLHCAGMCGPLALALPRVAGSRWAHVVSRLAYNAGRVVTYAALGFVFGLIGKSLAMAGVQRWVSIGLGVVLLAAVLVSRAEVFRLPAAWTSGWLKPALGRQLRRRGVGSLAVLGLLNGLLPCGLVYVACAGAAAMGTVQGAVEYMIVFGLGTVPMMLGLALSGTAIQAGLRLRLQKAIPFCLGLVAVLLILRGLSLGIPYVSPDLSKAAGKGACCH